MNSHVIALKADLILKLELFRASSTLKEIVQERYENPPAVIPRLQAFIDDLELTLKRWQTGKTAAASLHSS